MPAVDDIADQIDRFGVVIAQEVQQPLGLATPRAEVDIGNKESTEPYCAVLKSHESCSRVCSIPPILIIPFHCSTMTTKVNGRPYLVG